MGSIQHSIQFSESEIKQTLELKETEKADIRLFHTSFRSFSTFEKHLVEDRTECRVVLFLLSPFRFSFGSVFGQGCRGEIRAAQREKKIVYIFLFHDLAVSFRVSLIISRLQLKFPLALFQRQAN